MPYWLQDTLAAIPALAWMFIGVGLPWALVALPRHDWRDRPVVALLALAFGPALVTAWLFALGSWQTPLLRLEWILGGTAVIAAAGWALVWRKQALTPSPSGRGERTNRLAPDEKLLIALIAAALVVRWLAAAYWPFTAYDALWVYGYEGRLYTLLGYIPNTIGYYPQFLPLQYTYLQLVTGGVINDHTARAVIPFLHLGSVLAAYALGSRLFSRRVGIYTAALWALYPHVAEWSRFGDLEIPTTFLFTAAAAFFLLAWLGKSSVEDSVLSPQQLVSVHKSSVGARRAVPLQAKQRLMDRFLVLSTQHSALGTRNYALIAGLLLGTGMWAKPTMGAFIWGVALLAVVEAGRWLYGRAAGIPYAVSRRARVVLWTALACVPLGAVWYVRNIWLGHEPITMPTGFWLTLAARSGAEFGWPLLAVLLLAGCVVLKRHLELRRVVSLGLGLALLLAGILPSIIEPRRMAGLEWLALAAGAALLAWTLLPVLRRRWPEETAAVGWALLLALPYFVTWFYSYSYHYRLSFPMVPLLILPSAVILVGGTRGLWQPHDRSATLPGKPALRVIFLTLIVLLAVPGVINALYDPNAGWDWLWSDEMPDDFSRYASGNQALLAVVDGLQTFEREHGRPPVVVAPGIVRLPFFFPTADIRTGAPTRLNELDGVDYFIYGTPETRGAYQALPPQRNQVVSALALADYDGVDSIMRKAWWKDDGNFNYTVYELHLERRFVESENGIRPQEGEVVFGGFVRYLGHNIGGDSFWPGRRLILNLFWEVIAPPTADYMVYIHLRDANGHVWQSWDGPVSRSGDGSYYSTLVWEPGEFIIDRRDLTLTNAGTPTGDKNYHIVIGLYHLDTGERVPMTINGESAGDGYTIPERLSIVPPP